MSQAPTQPDQAQPATQADVQPDVEPGIPADVRPDGQAAAAAPAAGAPTAADVEEAMRDVIDPELGINVVDLGLVYGVTADQNNDAVIDMTLTSAACPLTDVIEDQMHQATEGLVNSSRINWVWLPPWGPERITPLGREQLRALGFNV